MAWKSIYGHSTFWLALLGAALLLASFPLPTSWFGWLGPIAPNVDTTPWSTQQAVSDSASDGQSGKSDPDRIPVSGSEKFSDSVGIGCQESSQTNCHLTGTCPVSWPLPGPWYMSLAHLAWVAPVPWLVLVRCRQLPGRRPYLALWTVGFLYWLVQLHWLTLPYWAT
ncbi:MAG: hypothetical protein NZ602_12350, partial [Thermoguttaceae bacterium]|nr:hypothetical protein [Thermoguttaceae bacterium]MDW8036513.1 hypothetical protein [Thermoguttaceae bacterium]